MGAFREVVVTGIGVVSPIGIGRAAFQAGLESGAGGVRRLTRFETGGLPIDFGGEISDFDPKQYVRPLKSLKVMSRDIQLGVSAANLAIAESGLQDGAVSPERMGVLFGADMMFCEPSEVATAFHKCLVEGKFDFSHWGDQAFSELYPLWMLKYLPNMTACHVAISSDARGPNNSITLGEVSSLLAVAEAARIIERGQADVMLAGGTGSRIHPMMYVRGMVGEMSQRRDDPAAACRPFDLDRDGAVHGEGSAVFVLEDRKHAQNRRAKVLANIASAAGSFEPRSNGQAATGRALRSVIRTVIHDAGLSARDIGHVNAHGASTTRDDAVEAQAIAELLGDVPVTAPKSHFGNLGAGSGAVELAASLVMLSQGTIPRTLNYRQPDPACPVNVVSEVGRKAAHPTVLAVNQAATGQAAAVLLSAAD